MAETQTIEGRSLKPLSKKLNPIWWFLNDDEEQTAPWYQPKWPQWRRDFYWNFLRNPLQNFRCYVIGVADRNYTVTGRAPVMTVQRDDLAPPENGWQWCVIKLGALRLPFVSYAGPRIVCYLGWQPSGIFGAKFNIKGSAYWICDLCSLASASCRLFSWISSKSRTFSIAITAWSAKVVSNSICLSVNGRGLEHVRQVLRPAVTKSGDDAL